MADAKTYTDEEIEALFAEREKGLKANRDEALREAKKAKNDLKNFDGIDPEEFRRLKTASEEADRKKAAAEGDFSALQKQLVDKHATEIAARDAKIAKRDTWVEKSLVDAELTRAITAKKGDADGLLPFARQFVKVRETEDGFEHYVADAKGNPLIADGQGTPMNIDAFVEQALMTKFPRMFEGTGSSGGGAPRTPAGGGGGKPFVLASDKDAFMKNVAKIATGEVEVRAG